MILCLTMYVATFAHNSCLTLWRRAPRLRCSNCKCLQSRRPSPNDSLLNHVCGDLRPEIPCLYIRVATNAHMHLCGDLRLFLHLCGDIPLMTSIPVLCSHVELKPPIPVLCDIAMPPMDCRSLLLCDIAIPFLFYASQIQGRCEFAGHKGTATCFS